MNKPHIVVGCPVYERAWSLPKWFSSLRKETANFKISLAFIRTPDEDGTLEMLERGCGDDAFELHEIATYEGKGEDSTHDWTSEEKVRAVAEKRNLLLDLAASFDPDYFLSLDSDTYMSEGGLARLVEGLSKGYDAISPKVLIWGSTLACMRYVKGLLTCVPRKGVGIQPVDVVTTSAVLMTKKLLMDKTVRYGVFVRGKDFDWHPGGLSVDGWDASEMFAWSAKAKGAGYKLALHYDLEFEHRMKA